ncbi:unnamed protein product [Arctia plantaginis]|uniref:Reverse transcriptase RNase H-like domain-containing protein n=1 Tax=Arctia plantaginis TaxID=874455 RepID=A0A8S1BND4_ARCPL|nr:unnamed protein product [Arctia plantaginis]
MSETELRYSQIEKEALALTWAAEKFQEYITGLDIVLETDHKPLLQLLQTKNLDDLTPRLQRFRISQSNGLAENAVKIAKHLIKKNEDNIDKALLEYRSTPLENGFSPAELLMGRKLRTFLPILPRELTKKNNETVIYKEKEIKNNQQYYYDKRHRTKQLSDLNIGDKKKKDYVNFETLVSASSNNNDEMSLVNQSNENQSSHKSLEERTETQGNDNHVNNRPLRERKKPVWLGDYITE